MDVYHLLEIFLTNIKSKFGYRTACFKTCFQKVVHKTGNCSGKKLQNVVTNSHRICWRNTQTEKNKYETN